MFSYEISRNNRVYIEIGEVTINNPILREFRVVFEQIGEKNIQEGLPLKHTSALEEIHSLAADLLLSKCLNCSDDADICEVIIELIYMSLITTKRK